MWYTIIQCKIIYCLTQKCLFFCNQIKLMLIIKQIKNERSFFLLLMLSFANIKYQNYSLKYYYNINY